jgi:hypothetical protein
MHKA